MKNSKSEIRSTKSETKWEILNPKYEAQNKIKMQIAKGEGRKVKNNMH